MIFGDDIGQANISAYSFGLMGYRTPNIDRVAKEGMMFTDYYAEQSCTAGRSSFITGQCTLRTGLSKVGIPGATVGLQARDATIAELLKPLGYATGQFGKNHLGDRNEYLPTVHGFDEFYGNLYHLNAEEDPENRFYPTSMRDQIGPRACCAARRRIATSRPSIRAGARSASRPYPAQSLEGWLASLRAKLLPTLPPGRAACRTNRYLDQPCRLPLRHADASRRSPRTRRICCNLVQHREYRMSSELENRTTTSPEADQSINRRKLLVGTTSIVAAATLTSEALAQSQKAAPATSATASGRKPNILVIFGDDIGQTNITAYSFGVMGYRTPNIDRVAKEGMMFTDYYAEQSCTAGRSSFITGQCTLRTGLIKGGHSRRDRSVCRRETRPSPSC